MEAVTDSKRLTEDSGPDRLRDALFENMALQTGLVRPEELAEARREQSLSPSHLLADVLVKRQALSEKARQGLELLLEEQSLARGPSVAMNGNGFSTRPGETLSLDTVRVNPSAPAPRKFAGYELLAEIARGGMGVVFKARQVKLDRNVALKMILSGEFSGEEQIRRFYSEAEAAARLDHPNIVPVYEVGESGGQHYYSMALIEGCSLHELVKKDGPLPARQAAQFMKAIAQAIGYAHNKGIVHRDLKPQNILLEGGEHPKVTDFGLAKQVNGISDLTLTGQVLGTPSYMSPEQAAGKGSSVGPLADVYALGATLYFLLAGHAPFQGSSAAEIIRQVLDTEPVPLRRINPAIPRDLETICLKCLRKERGDRYESAEAVALDLRRWLASEPIIARPVSRLERVWLWCRRRPAMATGLAASVLLVAAASVITRERLQTVRAAGLVDAVVTSDTRELEGLLTQLRSYRRWAAPLLRQKLAEGSQDSKQKLHASLCLVESDSRQCDYLLERLASATPEESLNIGRALLPHHEDVGEQLWRAMEKPADRGSRLRTASALVVASPADDRWRKWSQEIASQLVTLPPFEAGPWVSNLRPIRSVLALDLERIYRETETSEAMSPETKPVGTSERALAASALANYLAEEPARMVDLVLLSQSADEFQPLLAALRPHQVQASAAFRKVLAEVAPSEVPQLSRDILWKPHEERDRVWRRQALAAVALVNLGDDAQAWELLRRSADPTLRSYVVIRFHQLGTPYHLLWSRLRGETDPGVQQALVLSLGSFGRLDFAAIDLETLTPELLRLYQTNPDSGVHSAAAWTLRRWQMEEALKAANPAANGSTLAGEGNWLTDSRGETFVRVSGPVSFVMFEKTNQTVPARITLDYPFAVATHEVTIHQFRQFDPAALSDVTYAPTLDCPLHMVYFRGWQSAASYCNWLSEREGLPRDQWAYEGEPASGLALALNFIGRRGYRLPTEAEWEYVCKAGTTTMFCCGDTVEALNGFAWHQNNASARCWPVGTKMPNDLGAFDMHGNVMEWCHRQTADKNGKLSLSLGTAITTGTLRSGSYYLGPMAVRSNWRWVLPPPQEFYASMGFRVARSLPEK